MSFLSTLTSIGSHVFNAITNPVGEFTNDVNAIIKNSSNPSTPSTTPVIARNQLVTTPPQVTPPMVSPTSAGIVGGVNVPGVFEVGGHAINPRAILPGGTPFISNVGPGGQVPRGYHINKAAQKGKPYKHLVVKNRHDNPGNGRAVRHAERRLAGFLRLSRRVARSLGYTLHRSGTAKSTRKHRR